MKVVEGFPLFDVFIRPSGRYLALTDIMELGLAYSSVTTRNCLKKGTVESYMKESNWIDWRSLMNSQDDAIVDDQARIGGVLPRPRKCPL